MTAVVASAGCVVCATKRNTPVALAELERKLRLENMFKREIRSIFRRMVADFRVSVAATGRAPSGAKYNAQWRTALEVQYERVHKAFKGEVVAQNGRKSLQFWLGKQALGDANELEDLALLRWRDDMSEQQARIIMETNDAEMQLAIDRAREALQADGEILSARNIAAAAMAILATRFIGRTNTIAQTETQAAAEVTKQIEAEIIAGVVPFVLRGFEPGVPVFVDDVEPQAQREITKTWDTVGDSRVRASHVAADGNTVASDDIFVLVTGSMLRFPGDTSLGAAVEDVINCRCSARYQEGTPTATPTQTNTPRADETQNTGPVGRKPDEKLSPQKRPGGLPEKTQDVRKVESPQKFETTEKVTPKDFTLERKLTAKEKQYAEWYTGDGFHELNDYLRNPTRYLDKSKSLNVFAENLDSAISKVKTNRDITLFRGVNNKEFRDAVRGGGVDVLEAHSFQSTSASVATAEAFGGKFGTLMRIKVPKGSSALPVSSVSRNASEAEVLLPRGGKYKIIKSTEEEIVKGVKRTVLDVEWQP